MITRNIHSFRFLTESYGLGGCVSLLKVWRGVTFHDPLLRTVVAVAARVIH